MLTALLETKLPGKGKTLNGPGHKVRAGQLQFSSLKHLKFVIFLVFTSYFSMGCFYHSSSDSSTFETVEELQ